MSFRDHFPGSSLDARYGVLTAAGGSVTVSDSKAICDGGASAGDVGAFYIGPISPTTSQVFRFFITKAVEGTSDNCVWLLSESGGPSAGTFAATNGKAVLRCQIDPGLGEVRLRRWDDVGTTLEYDGATDVWSATLGQTAFAPYAAGEYLELRLEIDGTGDRAGGAGGWRLVCISKPQTSTTWSDAQGMLHVERTPWVEWADSAFDDDLYLLFGHPLTNFPGEITHVEFLEHVDDALVHGWVNVKNQGGTWEIEHEVGHGEGLGPWSPPGVGADVAIAVGAAAAWDDAQVKDAHVLDNTDDDGLYYLYYAGSDGSVFQIGVATASSLYGPWTKDAGNPLIANAAATNRNQVAFPFVVRDDAEVDNGKRYKMLYVGISSTPEWRIFYAYAANPDGPFTLYDDGGGVNASDVLGPSGVGGAYDERGWSGPIFDWREGRWHVWGATKMAGAEWNIGLARGAVGDTEPTNLTKVGQNLEGHVAPIDALTADLNGVNVDIADTSGYAQDDYVVLIDNTSSSEQNTKYSVSRVRKVVSGTRLELYHSLRGFTTANGAAIRRMTGWSQHPRAIRRIGGSWYLFTTPFQPFADDATYGAYLESTGVFLSTGDHTGPWTPARIASPLMYLGQSSLGRRHSVENIALVTTPLVRSLVSVDRRVRRNSLLRM